MARIIHPIPPLFREDSEILILGSFPSVKSREGEFFYHHPQNRFWRMISSIYDEPVPITIPEKRALLLKHRIALWDVIHSCEIEGSADSSIKNVLPNDLTEILNNTVIKQIYTNGNTATRLYRKYIHPVIGLECIGLPSTSPANAGYGLDKLIREWVVIKKGYERNESSDTKSS